MSDTELEAALRRLEILYLRVLGAKGTGKIIIAKVMMNHCVRLVKELVLREIKRGSDGE